jgi:hypothetical protein
MSISVERTVPYIDELSLVVELRVTRSAMWIEEAREIKQYFEAFKVPRLDGLF